MKDRGSSESGDDSPHDAPAMPRYTAQTTDDHAQLSQADPSRGPATGQLGPAEVTAWLNERADDIGREWTRRLEERAPARDSEVDRVSVGLVQQIVRLLPWLLGPYREDVLPLWMRLSELFGLVAARRGLAAGEAIEEFQILRELVIRALYRDPPLGGELPLPLREVLRLNRALDRGVTQASVGHTDAMFFEFFEAEAQGPAIGDADFSQEVRGQLDAILEDFNAVRGTALANSLERDGRH